MPALRTLARNLLLQWFRFPYGIFPKQGFSVRRSRLSAFSCLSPSTWPDLHFGNQATARGALGPDVIEDECGDEEIRRQSLVLLGEILVETVDQADERYAKGAIYRLRLGCRVIAQKLDSSVGISHGDHARLYHPHHAKLTLHLAKRAGRVD